MQSEMFRGNALSLKAGDGGQDSPPRYIEIPSDVSYGMRILEVIVLELGFAGFDSRQIGRIELAYTEALINAIHHGNQDDPQRMVQIEYRVDSTEFRLAIEDEGSGFCREDVCDPTTEECILRPGGRGLLLIRSLVEHVDFNPQGNRIVIRVSKQARQAA